MAELRCYHHSNCADRQAVARCTRCGKGLCRECADKLKSEDTGDILCVDCLNAEMAADANWAMQKKASVKKEIILMVVGFIIGAVIEITLLALMVNNPDRAIYGVLFPLSFVLFLPTLLASFGLIIRTVRNKVDNFFIRIIFFLILCVASPVMFIVRIVRKAKQIKLLKRFAVIQIMKYEANQQYAEATRQMVSLPDSAEFRQQMMIKYNLFPREEADRMIADEQAKLVEAQAKNVELQKQINAASADIKKYNGEGAETRTACDNVDPIRRKDVNRRSSKGKAA